MKGSLFALFWTLILLAAAFDACYAWYYRDGFEGWEINPLARWIVHGSCVELLVAFKILVMAFATAMALWCHFKRNRWELPMTMVIGGSHLYLLIHYAVGYLWTFQPDIGLQASRLVP